MIMTDTAKAGALENQVLEGALGYDPTEGGQKPYNYGDD